MEDNHHNSPQKDSRLPWQKWINPRSCALGCVCYLAGFVTVPAILITDSNRPEIKKERFLNREINSCQNCDLAFQDFALRNFNEADFSGANLQEAIFGATQLSDANFSKANLERAILRQANLARANFEGANLSQADFSCGAGTCTYLSDTNFRNANLTGADFQAVGFTPAGETGLPNVDFTGADLTRADFTYASLKGALMEKAKLCETIMPDGTISNRDCP